jgi:hypothetical protein
MYDNINQSTGDKGTSVAGNGNVTTTNNPESPSQRTDESLEVLKKEIDKRLGKLEEKNKSSKERCLFTAFYWVSGASFLFSIIAICGAFVFKNTVIVDESIVLIFVGIVATFVVVGNYAQVKDIENKFNKETEGIKDYVQRELKIGLSSMESNIKNESIASARIDALMPKFNAYRELISHVSCLDLWNNESKNVIKEYDRCKRGNNREGARTIKSNNNFLSLYDQLEFIEKEYSSAAVSETLHEAPNENIIKKYREASNGIWHAINHRTDTAQCINSNVFESLDCCHKNMLLEYIKNVDPKYLEEELSISLIAKISGEMEVEVIIPMAGLISKINN